MSRPVGFRPYFDDDGIAIYHADCLEVLPAIDTESIDFTLTDPPYLVDHRGRWDRKRKAIVGDDDPTWLGPAYREIYRVMKPDSFVVTFYGWPHADLFVGVFKDVGFRLVSHLAFVKNVWGLGRYTRGQHETAYLLAKGQPPMPARGVSDVIEWEREADAFHPHQKPVAALRPLIASFAPHGGVVLDPFMGSGSTLRAAKDFGLDAVGIEVDERYCRQATQRMAQRILFARSRE